MLDNICYNNFVLWCYTSSMIVGDCIIKAYQKLKYKNDDGEKELE